MDSPANRVIGKSPPNRVRWKTPPTGLGHLENGQPFIAGWPSKRDVADVHLTPCQTLAEAAARWLEIGISIASEQAAAMPGKSLLLQKRTLRCTSNFTGFLEAINFTSNRKYANKSCNFYILYFYVGLCFQFVCSINLALPC